MPRRPLRDLPPSRWCRPDRASGRHAAFDAERNPCERNLFAVIRIEDGRRPR